MEVGIVKFLAKVIVFVFVFAKLPNTLYYLDYQSLSVLNFISLDTCGA